MERKSHRTTGFVGVASVILLALGLAGLNMLLSVQAVALDLDFYVAKWAELDIPASAKMSMEDLRLAGTKLLGYFTGSEADPQLYGGCGRHAEAGFQRARDPTPP